MAYFLLLRLITGNSPPEIKFMEKQNAGRNILLTNLCRIFIKCKYLPGLKLPAIKHQMIHCPAIPCFSYTLLFLIKFTEIFHVKKAGIHHGLR
jgi:hypothetical protein